MAPYEFWPQYLKCHDAFNWKMKGTDKSLLTRPTETEHENEKITAERRLTFVFTDMSNAPVIGSRHIVKKCTRKCRIAGRGTESEVRDMISEVTTGKWFGCSNAI